MPHRDGKKFGGNHTTCIDLAAEVADIAVACKKVTKISLGFIRCGGGVAGGTRKVKIGNMTGGILVIVRQSKSVQEIRIFTTDAQATKLALARALRNREIPILFSH